MRYLLALTIPGLILFGLLKAFAATQTKTTDASCGFVQNVYGHRLAWKGTEKVIFYLHKSVPAEMVAPIEKAMATWEKSLGKKIFVINKERVDTTKDLKKLKDGKNVIYWFKKGEWKGEADDQARTIISWVGSEIHEADILFNADTISFANEAPKANQIDLQSVALHELGHVLGLKHDENGVMTSFLKENTERRQLVAMDLEKIKCEY